MTVAFATFAAMPEGNAELPLLREALRSGFGIESAVTRWDDPLADWSAHELVVIRSTWDYTTRLEEFLGWARAVPRLANPVDVVRWNTDKRYLRDLAEAGVPVVPTLWDPADLPSRWPDLVIKPAVSAGARGTARWGPSQRERARAHLRELLGDGETVMVQPYLTGIDTEGETALLFFDGEFSHAARKGPILAEGTGVAEEPRGGDMSPATAAPEQLAVARRALAAVPHGADLLYARVDLVPGPDGTPVVLELELTEPDLFLDHAPGSADRFARAIAARVTGASA
ncbi:ATP-grasp domain-containing protein [Spirillospora sp. CA-294931]|uniref:ATP-grasp domain-containing protein n=1 Tax=Spirillospora sp. CA-294931 TaxID=3240042 RepID=UPI003D8A3E49